MFFPLWFLSVSHLGCYIPAVFGIGESICLLQYSVNLYLISYLLYLQYIFGALGVISTLYSNYFSKLQVFYFVSLIPLLLILLGVGNFQICIFCSCGLILTFGITDPEHTDNIPHCNIIFTEFEKQQIKWIEKQIDHKLDTKKLILDIDIEYFSEIVGKITNKPVHIKQQPMSMRASSEINFFQIGQLNEIITLINDSRKKKRTTINGKDVLDDSHKILHLIWHLKQPDLK